MDGPELRVRRTETEIGPTLVVEIVLGKSGVTTPEKFAKAVADLGLKAPCPGYGAIVDGRAPVWGYAMLAHAAHPFAWVATHDPRLGAVVVTTHRPEVALGSVFPFPQA